jgi:hypothetical protein
VGAHTGRPPRKANEVEDFLLFFNNNIVFHDSTEENKTQERTFHL